MVAILKLEAREVLAQNIKRLRELRKFTQKDLSWYIGLGFKYINNIEHQKEKASIGDIYPITKTLDVTFKEWFL